MPTYEYECSACHVRFERRQRFDEEPVATCPRCQGKARRVILSVPVIFKGSGFYVTDHRKSSPTTTAEDKTTSETGTKAETKTEAKSEAKTEAKTKSKNLEKVAAKE